MVLGIGHASDGVHVRELQQPKQLPSHPEKNYPPFIPATSTSPTLPADVFLSNWDWGRPCSLVHISHLQNLYCSRCCSDSWPCLLIWGREEKDPPSCILPGYWDLLSLLFLNPWVASAPPLPRLLVIIWAAALESSFWHHKTVIPKMFHLLVEMECRFKSTPLCMSHPVGTGLISCLVVVLFCYCMFFSFAISCLWFKNINWKKVNLVDRVTCASAFPRISGYFGDWARLVYTNTLFYLSTHVWGRTVWIRWIWYSCGVDLAGEDGDATFGCCACHCSICSW